MTETTNLNIRIDKELKEQAEVFFNKLGLNMSSAFDIFVRQSIKEANEGKFVVKTLDELWGIEE